MRNGHQTNQQTDRQTDRHVDSMTDPAQRAESVKTKWFTDKINISQKIMQGNVLSSLVSSNMVDNHVGRNSLDTGNTDWDKNRIAIAPRFKN